MSIRSQRIVCLILRCHCLLVCPHKRSLLLSERGGEGHYQRERQEARPMHLDHGSARFQASGGGRIAGSMISVASCSIDASFCLMFKNINATNFRSSSFATNLFISSHEILQYENFPMYGNCGLDHSVSEPFKLKSSSYLDYFLLLYTHHAHRTPLPLLLVAPSQLAT